MMSTRDGEFEREGRAEPHPARPWLLGACLGLGTAIVVVLLAAGVIGVSLAMGGKANAAPAWASDVSWAQLGVGSCIAESFDAESDDALAPFNLDAAYFSVVHCSTPHVAQVLSIVNMPITPQWDSYGTLDGPTQAEADAWVDDMCSALGALVREYRSTSGADLAFSEVRAIHGAMGQRFLGYCVLFDSAGLPPKALDVDAIRRAAVGE